MSYLPRALTVALITAGLVPATSAAQVSASYGTQACAKTFTLPQFQRAALATYAGTSLPPVGSYSRLWRYARCSRPPSSEAKARAVWATAIASWRERRAPPMSYSTVSWYDDSGTTASGGHATYGFAACGYGECVPMWTRVEFCYQGRCIVGQRDDSGPYVPGRGWDLSGNLASALGFSGLGVVAWRILS